MANQKSILTLVLESYLSSCRMMANLNDDTGDAINALTSALIKSSYSMQLSMFRNILMDAELTSNEANEVELVLKRVEAEHTNKEVLESVDRLRGNLFRRSQPAG